MLDEFEADVVNNDQDWENFDSGGGNGWVRAVPVTNDPTIGTNFEQHADGHLQYKSSYSGVDSWQVAYATQRDDSFATTIGQSRPTREVYLEAYVECEHVSHVTWQDADSTWSQLRDERWTWEGPRHTVEGETGNVEMALEFRINEDGTSSGWGDWRRFVPGKHRVVDVQFRVRFRRHDSGQNVKMTALHTRVTVPKLSLEQSTRRDRFESVELY